MKIKSITLSITELTEILSLDDADARRYAVETLNEAAAEPENIDADRYAGAHPLVQTLVEKVGRKVEANRRRAETRAARKQAKEQAKKQDEKQSREQSTQAKEATQANIATEPNKTTHTIHVEMTDTVVKRLLWLRQNLYKTLGRLTDALTAQPDEPIGAEMANILSIMMEPVTRYIDPMMEAAAAYMRTPRRLRPATAAVPVTLRL